MNSSDKNLIADAARKRFLVISQHMRREADSLPVTTTQGAILSLLQVSPKTISDLATVEGTRTPTISQVVKRMEESGWVSRPSGQSRGKLISLTENGLHMCNAVKNIRNKLLAERLVSLSDDELSDLNRLLFLVDKIFGAPKY